jgi:cell division protein FtsB
MQEERIDINEIYVLIGRMVVEHEHASNLKDQQAQSVIASLQQKNQELSGRVSTLDAENKLLKDQDGREN